MKSTLYLSLIILALALSAGAYGAYHYYAVYLPQHDQQTTPQLARVSPDQQNVENCAKDGASAAQTYANYMTAQILQPPLFHWNDTLKECLVEMNLAAWKECLWADVILDAEQDKELLTECNPKYAGERIYFDGTTYPSQIIDGVKFNLKKTDLLELENTPTVRRQNILDKLKVEIRES